MQANIDFEGLYEIADGDEDFLFSILLVIDKNLKEFPIEMDFLLKENDLGAFGKKAHKLKSSTAYLGHEEMEGLLIEMEDASSYTIEELTFKLKLLFELSKGVLTDIQKKIEDLS